MTTKVLLIFPNPSISSPQKSPPLSILHVGESLKSAKVRGKSDETYQIRYYDERYDDKPDMDWPDVVGVSSMTGHQLVGAIHWLKEAKKHGKRTILGGVHATMQPYQCLDEDYVDSVVMSEGENAVIEAIHGESKKIYQSHLGKNDHVSPVSADTLKYFQRSAKAGDTILLTSRGCQFRCGFCFNVKFYDRKWQSVDMERWKRDIIYLRNEAGVRKLSHGDDWIGVWPRAKSIISFLSDNGIQYWPSLRANQVTEDVAIDMVGLGLKHVSIGMETGSERLLDLAQKDIQNIDQVRAAIALSRHGIWPMYYWILGLPTETREELNRTLKLSDEFQDLHNGHVTQTFFAYRATPGSALWDMVDKTKLPKTMEEWSKFDIGYKDDKFLSAIYTVGGLSHHRSKGDKTDQNFPGLSRALIYPFEVLAEYRWKHRKFGHYEIENACIDGLLKWASSRKE